MAEIVHLTVQEQSAEAKMTLDPAKIIPAISPSATVERTEDGAIVTVTDKDGTTQAEIHDGKDGTPGTPGQPGVSPTIRVTDIPGGHRITITDATGEHSFDVMDGSDAGAPVQDVQVNGMSVLQDGVANVPVASSSEIGVVKIDGSYGLWISKSDGILKISCAGLARTKAGTNAYEPIVASHQHESTFYGLAKAAGADMKNSSNPVGMYTEDAKIAIQKMLGIYQAPWELIREDTFTNATEANHIIEVDGNGNPFELTDVYLEFWLPKQDTEASVSTYGRIDYYYNDVYFLSTYHGTKTQTANNNPNGTFAYLKNDNGAIYKVNGTYNTMGTDRVATSAQGRVDQNQSLLKIGSFSFRKIAINSIKGTGHYKLYGKRKWQ